MFKVEGYGLYEVVDIDLYLDKDVEYFSFGLGDWDQTRVSVVYEQITVHLLACQIVNAAGSICDISHDDCLYFYPRKLSQDVTDDAGEQHETFRELQ